MVSDLPAERAGIGDQLVDHPGQVRFEALRLQLVAIQASALGVAAPLSAPVGV